MNGLFEKASLEVYFENGTDKPGKQTFANLQDGVSVENLGAIRDALTTLSADPVGDVIVVERTRYSAI